MKIEIISLNPDGMIKKASKMNKYVGEVNDSDFDHVVLQSQTGTGGLLGGMVRPVSCACAERHASSARVLKVNVDDSPGVTEGYGIRGIPTLILFQDGLEKERIVGVVSQQQISSLIDRYTTAASNSEVGT
jgi:hypothetical protein